MNSEDDALDEAQLDFLRSVVREGTGISDQGYEPGRGVAIHMHGPIDDGNLDQAVTRIVGFLRDIAIEEQKRRPE